MDQNLQIIISSDSSNAQLITALKNFIAKGTKSFSFPELDHNDCRRLIWQALHKYLINGNAAIIHADCLNSLRLLSRDKTSINELINENLLETVLNHCALRDDRNLEDIHNYTVAIEALKCLCNLIFNSPVGTAISAKNDTLGLIIRRLRTYRVSKLPPDIKYFDIKIIFLLTALCPELRLKFKTELHGLTYMIEALDLTLKENNECRNGTEINADIGVNVEILTDTRLDLSCEILKVLFNITMRPSFDYPVTEEEEALHVRLVTILHDYLVIRTSGLEKRTELTNHVVNLLTNMPNQCYKGLIVPCSDACQVEKEMQFEEHDMSAINEIVEFLERRFQDNATISNQNELLSPVLTTLLRTATSDRMIRKYLRIRILPPLTDVHNRPEEGNTLRNNMCKLLTTPIVQVRDLAAELLFVLCKENVHRMIKYTGYGNAAGLFATRGLLGGKYGDVSKYSSDSEDSDTDEYKEYKHGINPVVGCYEPPRVNPTAHMTEEQKEYEAMKLVELMDNLTRTGMVQPCKVGEDGRPVPVEHVLELQEGIRMEDDSDD